MSQEMMFPEGVFVTGHRPPTFGDWDEKSEMAKDVKRWLYLAIERAIKKGRTHFITGLAVGVDIWFGEAVLALKDKYPHIKLIAAVPYPGQPERWAEFNQVRWNRLTQASDELHVLFNNPAEDAPKFEYAKRLNGRNEWMVNACPVGMAVHHSEHIKGGTVNCLRYAKKMKRPVLVYDPLKKEESWQNKT